MKPSRPFARIVLACSAAAAAALLVPAARAATCPDGSMSIFISGMGEFCPDASGHYTVPKSAPRGAPEATPAAAKAPPSSSGRALQSGNVRLLQACRDLDCRLQEGWQPGMTTVEVHGRARQYAGRSLEIVVRHVASHREVLRRRVGVLIGGDFSTSIAAYDLPAGEYAFGFRPITGNETVGTGAFAVDPHPAARPPAKRRKD